MTYRRFTTLVGGLPGDSAWGAFLRDRKARSLNDVGAGGAA